MKMTVHKLGRIQDAEIDVRPLTVFVGPNNTNKSWAAFALAEAYGSTSYDRDVPRNYPSTLAPEDPEMRVISGLRDAFGAMVGTELQSVIERVDAASPTFGLDIAGVRFADYLRVDPALMSDCRIRIEFDALDRREPAFDSLRLGLRPAGDAIEFTAALQRSAAQPVKASGTFRAEHLTEFLALYVYRLSNALRRQTVTFPVERHLLLPLDAGAAERLRTLAAFQGPVGDFVAWIGRARALAGGPVTGAESGVATLVETAILGGSVGADLERVEFESGGVRVPVQAAASMVRSLAGLPLYLRQLARPADALVIDEPEMNAHPRAQLGLAELFATLANRGYRVVITTHSPYVLDHLSALLAASRLTNEDARRRVAQRLQLGTPEAFIDPEHVAVYEFSDSSGAAGPVIVEPVLDRDAATIDAATFARESDRISATVNAILDEEDAQ